MKFKTSDDTLEVYAEGRLRRAFVGVLKWHKATDTFEFTYEKKYLMARNSIAVGPELPLSKRVHTIKDKLFPSFQDRIPSRGNPAYEEYCKAAGISPKERNPIILLGAIGRRGPSTFVFEPVVDSAFEAQKELTQFRSRYRLSLHELGLALDLNAITLQRIEAGKSKDPSTSRLLEIFLTTPSVIRQQLQITGRRIHRNTYKTLMDYSSDIEDNGTGDKNLL